MNLNKIITHEDREVPKKFKLTNENRRKLEIMNAILTDYMLEF